MKTTILYRSLVGTLLELGSSQYTKVVFAMLCAASQELPYSGRQRTDHWNHRMNGEGLIEWYEKHSTSTKAASCPFK